MFEYNLIPKDIKYLTLTILYYLKTLTVKPFYKFNCLNIIVIINHFFSLTMKLFLFTFIYILTISLTAQQLYLPPEDDNQWEHITPESLNWCTQEIPGLYDFLQSRNTKAFIVLKDGKIVLEKYFDTFTRDSNWYWASAGKTLTSVMIGIANERNLISLNDSTSKYLGNGWTNMPQWRESKIKIINHLTMTTGLDDYVDDPFCTLPSCLNYKADPGTRWAYHNAPYTLLDSIIIKSSGQTLNQFFAVNIRNKIGMSGIWIKLGYNNIYYSNPLSMARFGLLIQNKGKWNQNTILADTNYYKNMLNTSQNLNLSYGYLWWLGGKASHMIPQTQWVFQGSFAPDAPDDMIAALGKNGQILNIIPSKGLIVVRMGNAPDSSLEVPTQFNNSIWQNLNKVICNTTSVNDNDLTIKDFYLSSNYPNPFNPSTTIEYKLLKNGLVKLSIYDITGSLIETIVNEYKHAGSYKAEFRIKNAKSSGIYFYRLQITGENGSLLFNDVKKMSLIK